MLAGRILLVDDDKIALRLTSSILRDRGYEVTIAVDGPSAIAQLASEAFDVVVSDIWMPGADGIEVLYAARSLPTPPEVVLLTGSTSVETAVAALRAGAYNYLMKPYDAEELLSVIALAVQQRRALYERAAAIRKLAAELATAVSSGNQAEALGAPHSTFVNVLDQEEPERYMHVGALTIDRHRRNATFEEQPIHLTPIEYTLLTCLAECSGKVVTWSEIASRTHGTTIEAHEAHELLRVHIRNLRRKIPPTYLITVRGIGFILADPNETQ